jgi:hypothetical protein
MSASHRHDVIDIYQTDLDRHLFAPARRLAGRNQGRLSFEPLSDWLRDWLLSGLSRWRALAEAWDLG